MKRVFVVFLALLVVCDSEKGQYKLQQKASKTVQPISLLPNNIIPSSVSSICNVTFPTATGTEVVQATKNISKDTDFGLKRFIASPKLGGNSVNEKDHPILFLDNGITISNAIIGSLAAKGIWCKGSCTLINIWWENVGTHAANFGASPIYWANPGNKYIVEGGGVQNAADKVFVQQGAGTTYISNFHASNCQKLWRACGDCVTQFKNRDLFLTNVTVTGPMLSVIALNRDLGDKFNINGLNLCNSKAIKYVCQAYKSNTNYNVLTGENYRDHPEEKINPGKPLNGKGCRSKNATINIIN